MKHLISLNLLILISIFPLWAQETGNNETKQLFSLDQALEYAKENNRDIQNSQLDIESAKKKVWETTAMGLPQAEAGFDYTHIFDDAIELPFPDPMNPGQNSTIDFKPTSNLTLNANQLIFSGEYIVGLKTVAIFKSISEKNLVKTEQETIEAVTNAYIMILVLKENRQILEENLNTIEQNIFEMKEMLKSGLIEDTDVDQLEISKRNLETTLSNLSRQVELGYKLLKINMGMPLDTELILSQTMQGIMDKMIKESLQNIEFNAEQNIDFQLLQTQEEMKTMELRQQQVGYLPTIAGFYSHTEKLKKPEFDMTPNDLIGVNVTLPLFSSGQRHAKVQQARIELDKLDNSKSALRDGLNMQYEQAIVNYNTAFSKYLNESENTKLTKKIYDKTLIKYREGVASSLDLSQVQSQHLQAQTNYYNAILELIQAKTSLDKLMTNPEN
ncbi:MAG: TolC family protein [Bacteroidales bacterium]|nr:TolC family protein [Bacteroidales bacterium]